MTIQDIIREELENLKSDIITRHELSGQKASGDTEKGFEVQTPASTIGQLLGYDYSGVLETGRKPGKIPYDFADILKRWAQSKGLSFKNESDFDRWANAVAWKIKREGNKLYRSGITQDIFNTPIEQFQTRLNARISYYFESEISNQIFS